MWKVSAEIYIRYHAREDCKVIFTYLKLPRKQIVTNLSAKFHKNRKQTDRTMDVKLTFLHHKYRLKSNEMQCSVTQQHETVANILCLFL
jgi:hypothetical protein